MKIWFPFSATILQEGNLYVSICPEADIICKGETVQEAIESNRRTTEAKKGTARRHIKRRIRKIRKYHVPITIAPNTVALKIRSPKHINPERER